MRLRGLVFALTVLVLLSVTALAQEYVTITTTADVQYTNTYAAITQGNSLTITIYLPFKLSSLNDTYTNLTVVADADTASTTVNVTVNGYPVATNYEISGGAAKTWTLADFEAAGVDMNATSLVIVIEAIANNTTSETLNISCNDGLVVANFSYTVTETKLSTPQIKFDADSSFYSVKQTITITQNSSVNLTDVNCTITYPSNAISRDISYYNFGTLNVSESKSKAVSFQKQGPYLTDIDTKEEDNKYIVEMKVYSLENLTANMEFDPTEEPWDDYFPDFSKDNIVSIKLNDVSVDWEDPENTIKMESLTLNKGLNTLNITYTKVGEVIEVPPEEVTWYSWLFESVFGAPVLLWIIVAAILVIGIYSSRR